MAGAPAASQVLRGTVLDRATGHAISQGFVVALDDAHREVARTLTAPDGTFRIELPTAGAYRLRWLRVGYGPDSTSSVFVSRNAEIAVDFRVRPLPVRLDRIVVEEANRCGDGPGRRAVAPLWQEIEKAIDAASWTRSQQFYRYHTHNYERDLSSNLRRVEREQSRRTNGFFQTPFIAEDAEALQRDGYVVDRRDGLYFYAPDVTVLRSPTFLSAHCFGVVRDRDHPGLVGLSIEPTRDTRRPDMRGVLWVDERTAELRRLEYEYTEVPIPIEAPAGGTVAFVRLPSGAWIVSAWEIAMPLLTERDRLSRGERYRLEVTGSRRVGGQILRVEMARGETLYEVPPAVIAGRIVDPVSGALLAGATVRVQGTSHVATPNARGTFAIRGPLAGEYGVTVEHPVLDSLGYRPEPVTAYVSAADSIYLELSLPTPTEVFVSVCGDDGGPGRRAVRGTIVGAPPDADLVVRASWQDFTTINEGTVDEDGITVSAGGDGSYLICGVPRDRIVSLSLRVGALFRPVAAVIFDTAVVHVDSTGCLDQALDRPGVWSGVELACIRDRVSYPTFHRIWRQDLRYPSDVPEDGRDGYRETGRRDGRRENRDGVGRTSRALTVNVQHGTRNNESRNWDAG